VVGPDGTPRGLAPAADLLRGGTVADHTRRTAAWVPLGAPLKQALSTMLRHDAGWVAVLDGDRVAGVLTPSGLHEALRRSVRAGVAVESVS
jgi:osmoprotectant transport system ATP-binding protein